MRSPKFRLTGRLGRAILPTMRPLELSVERRVWLWAVVGPLLVLLSACVCALKSGELGLILSLTGVVALPLCFFLRLRGFFLSVLLTVTTLLLSGQIAEGWPWIGGVLLSLSIGFLVSTLAAQEFVGEVRRLEMESESRFQEMVALDHQWKQAEEWWHRRERELSEEVGEAGRLASSVQERLNLMSADARHYREQIHVLEVTERRLSYERDERASQVQQLRDLANQVRCDLFQARLDLKASGQKSEPVAEEREGLCSQMELESCPPVDRAELSQLRHRLAQAEEQLFAKSYLLDEQEERLRHDQSQLQRKAELERHLTAQCETIQGELADLNKQLLTALQVVGVLKPFRHQYEQLRDQFAEKCAVLDQTRAELFEAQEKLLLLERERGEQLLLPTPLEEMLADRTVEIEQEQERIEAESERLRELVGNLLCELASRSVLRPDCLHPKLA